jgi:hypothetical protein
MSSLLALTPQRPSLSALPTRIVLAPGRNDALTQAEIAEIARRLVHAVSKAERDHLLAIALTHAARRAGGGLTEPIGTTLGGMLKGLEAYEAADPRAYATAVRFVRLAGEAARAAVLHPAATPRSTAASALATAATRHAPHLLPALATHREARAARWTRNADGVIVVHLAASPPRELELEEFGYDPETEYFLGRVIHSVAKSASSAVKAVSRVADKVGSAVGGIPIVGDIARGALGAARLSLGTGALAIDAGVRVAKGENLGSALKHAVGGQIGAVRDQLKLAEMVAPFVPGIGSGVAAALGAANALAAGKPITEAVLAAARSSLPGGAVAQAAFDVALNLAKGQNIADAALSAARNRLPGGPAARAAFDAAVALGKGKRLQDVAFAAAGKLLPPSPYAADALSFAQRVTNGQNIQHAALSVVGRSALRKLGNNPALRNLPSPAAIRNLPGQAAMRAVRPALRQATYRSAMKVPAAARAALRGAQMHR